MYISFKVHVVVDICHDGFKIELPITIGTYPISDEQHIQSSAPPETSSERITLPVSAASIMQQPVFAIAFNTPSGPLQIPEAASRPRPLNPSPPYPENGSEIDD